MSEAIRAQIIAAVKRAGVVGAGGAGFPTHVKIDAAVDIVIANGAECEPLLRANQQLMAVESRRLILGVKAVLLATGAHKGYIALKSKYAQAAANLQAALTEMNEREVELFFLPDIYPAGDEQVVVYEVSGRIVPEGGIPLQVGVAVANIETLLNVSSALEGQPVTDKYVTVCGAVQRPLTLKLPIGMPVASAIELAGGSTTAQYKVIDGGPMMGKIVSEDAVVTKTTGGILVLPAEHSLIRQKQTSWLQVANRAKAVCCNCVACTDVCPRQLLGHGLEPHRIMQAIGHGNICDASVLSAAFLCSECGACDSFGCPMGLSPRRVNAELKRQFAQNGLKNPHHATPSKARGNRAYRLIPTKRLLHRLGLSGYESAAPLSEAEIMPDEVRIPLRQHIGAPAEAVVEIGALVARGDLIAAIPDGKLGVNMHASIAGRVVAVADAITIQAL